MAVELFEGLRQPIGSAQSLGSVVLVPGGGGVFDVRVDGDLVYSKHETGRHAEEGEVLRLVRARLAR